MIPRLACCLGVAILLLSGAVDPVFATSSSEGPRVALRLVVKDSYGSGESMGRCSLVVASRAGKASFVVKDSGTTWARLFPSTWHVEGVSCAAVKTIFPAKISSFEIPDSSADLSLGTLAVVFQSESVAEEIHAAREKRRLIAGAVGGSMAGLVGTMVAREFVDELPFDQKVEAKADLKMRWNDRNQATEVNAILGHADAKRIPVKILREE